MDKAYFTQILRDILENALEDADEFGYPGLRKSVRISDFADAGLMSMDPGLVVRLPNGDVFQLTVQQSQFGKDDFDPEDWDDDDDHYDELIVEGDDPENDPYNPEDPAYYQRMQEENRSEESDEDAPLLSDLLESQGRSLTELTIPRGSLDDVQVSLRGSDFVSWIAIKHVNVWTVVLTIESKLRNPEEVADIVRNDPHCQGYHITAKAGEV